MMRGTLEIIIKFSRGTICTLDDSLSLQLLKFLLYLWLMMFISPQELVTIIKYVNWKQQQHIIRPQNFLASKLFSAPSVSIVSTTNKKVMLQGLNQV